MSAVMTAAAASVVLVHGAFVDGSGWKDVHDRLTNAGYEVTVVQNPTTTLADDVAATRRAIASATWPVILVGHSYGGVIISEAGNDPKVAALVFVAAFVPEQGESVDSLGKAPPPPGFVPPPFLPPQDGFVYLDKSRFHEAFCADVDAKTATFMNDAQSGFGLGAITGAVTQPAWKTRPSWYVLAKDDHMIPAAAQSGMAARAKAQVTEVKASHAVMVSQAALVAEVIEKAARAVVKQ